MLTGKAMEASSLDIFEFMNAIFNGGKGGGINEKALMDKEKMRKVFNKIDLDVSGDLDYDEFKKAALVCSMVITDTEIDKSFKTMNTGKTGRISFAEFSTTMTKLADNFGLSTAKMDKMNPDMRTVITLWDKHMNCNDKAAELFSNKLKDHSSMHKLKNVDLDRQVHMVYGMISNSIRALPNMERLTERLEAEGSKHVKNFAIGKTHYDAAKEALFETLPIVMGNDYDDKAKGLFEKYWNIMQDSMLKGK